VLSALSGLASLGVLSYLGASLLPQDFVTAPAALLAGLLILNGDFYLFLARDRGLSFALGAIPFHLLYHFYNGISFSAGTLQHLLHRPVPKEDKVREAAPTAD
jgi:hypothetical protein